MNNNILPFTGPRQSRQNRADSNLRSNVISLSDWKENGRAIRTAYGVFFMTQVLCTPGGAA